MGDLSSAHDAGVQAMIDAFAELTTLAWRSGADQDAVSALHGRFFDGKIAAGEAMGAAVILAQLWVDCRRCAP